MRTCLLVSACLCMPAVAPAQAAVTVDRHKLNATSVRLLSGGKVTAVAPTVGTITLKPREFVAARAAQPVARLAVSDHPVGWTLPVQLVGANAAGERLSLHPTVFVEEEGLRFRPATGDFRATLLVELSDDERPTGSRPLGQFFQVQLAADADSVSPDHVALGRTNEFARIKVIAAAPGDSVRVQLIPDFDPAPLALWVPVLRPGVTVRASPERIEGYGLEVTTLTIRAASAPSAVVTLSANAGHAQPSTVRLKDGTGEATLRSSGRGAATVRAESPPLGPGTAVVLFLWPWAFIVAAVVGGLAGSIIREGHFKFSKQQPIAWLRAVANTLAGALVGVIAAMAYAVGINLVDVKPTATGGEALVFVIAALGAVGGRDLLRRVLPAGK